MKPIKNQLIPRLLGAALLFSTEAWANQPLSVINASFEDPVLGDGQLSTAGTSIPGWAAVNSGNVRVINPGTFDLSLEAPDGANAGLVTSTAVEDGMSQLLTHTFQNGANYSLTAKVANTRFTTGFPGYRVQLLANNTVLAEDNNSEVVAEDAVIPSTVNYTFNAGAHAALVGQRLEIRLLSKGVAAGEEVAFDDVRLNVTLINPAANPGGPYTVPIAGSLSLDGTGSLASAGQTITTYEWDLNNDGNFSDATGATPSPIAYTALNSTWGMIIGANSTIQLRVTDNSVPPKTSTVSGIVKLAAPLRCQLGVLNLSANGGINPNTGNPWQSGDKYRLAFFTDATTTATSNNPNFYNDFATAQAWRVSALQGAYWRALVTVNLDPTTTQTLSPKIGARPNTGTDSVIGGDGVGGAGEPVYAMNGTTCIARNNADIWNAWSNPFNSNAIIRLAAGSTNNNSAGTPVVASQNVHFSPFLNQFGLGDTATIHGVDVWAGTVTSGAPANTLGLTTDSPTGEYGSSNANTTGRIWQRFTTNLTTALRLYAISVPLTVVELTETAAPTLSSIVDDRNGTDAILGVHSVVYTFTFSEPMNASTITVDNFENAGTATATIAGVRGTLNPAAFEVTVTPSTVGTLRLQTKVGAVIADPIGNRLVTTSVIPDDTTVTVVSDVTPPTLVSIEDNIAGGPIVAFNRLIYTVTFSEPVAASSVDIADFGNTGSAPITVNSVAPTGNPAVYTVTVTPTAAGNLTLAVLAGATISDLSSIPLATGAALPDDTTITVTPDPLPTLVSIADNQNGGPVFATQAFTYLVAFDQVINVASVDAGDFENGTGPAMTVNAVARTQDPSVFAVHVTPGGAGALTLRIKAGAVITNVNGTGLNTTAGIPDDTTITVNAGSGPPRGLITVNSVASVTGTTTTLSRAFDAGSSSKLVVIVTGENGNPGSLAGNCSGVSFEGIPLTQAVERNPLGGTPVDQIYNDIWYLDMAGIETTSGTVTATVDSRGSMTILGLSGTAPGFGQTAISIQASKSVVLSTGFANSIVIASHGMGGDGNTANVAAVTLLAPLTGRNATAQASSWDGHVTAYALVPTPGTGTYAFAGGNVPGTHTIAAEFFAAELPPATGYGSWTAGPFSSTLTDPNPARDFDGGSLATGIEWVVGGDPTNGGDDAGRAPTFSNTDPENFVFTFRRRDAAQADPKTTITVQYDTRLSGWTNATPGVNGVTINDSAVPEAGFRTVVVSIPKALAGAGGTLFSRLKVTVVP